MNTVDALSLDGRLHHPFRCCVIGQSQAGKTFWTINLIKKSGDLIDKKIEKIFWFYGADSPFRGEDPLKNMGNVDISFIKGIPQSFDEYINENSAHLLIFDDLFTESMKSDEMILLFTKWSSHSNCSVILLTQDFFQNGSGAGNSNRKTITRNSNYLCIFRNPLDYHSIQVIGQRIMPKHNKLFQKVFETACDQGRYLFIDGHHKSDKRLKFRSDILGEIQRIYEIEL